MLKVENLTVVYSHVVSVLNGISLTAHEQNVTALLGGNGSGKTTLMRSISGLLPVYDGEILEGRIELNNIKLDKLSAVDITGKIGLTYLMEGRPIFQYLTVKENLTAAASCRWDSKVGDDLEKVIDYFPPIRSRLRSKAGLMSGGEQQMLAMGMALMTKPCFLLLDEPSLGLAPIMVREIFSIIKRINEEEGIGILLSEQNANMALKISSYGYVMDNGRVVLDGPSEELINNTDIQASYLGGLDQEMKDYKQAKRYRRRKRWMG